MFCDLGVGVHLEGQLSNARRTFRLVSNSRDHQFALFEAPIRGSGDACPFGDLLGGEAEEFSPCDQVFADVVYR